MLPSHSHPCFHRFSSLFPERGMVFVNVLGLERIQLAPDVVSSREDLEAEIDVLSDRMAKESYERAIQGDERLARVIPASLEERAVACIREDLREILSGMAQAASEGNGSANDQMRQLIRLAAEKIAKRVCESLPLDPLTGLPNRKALEQRLSEEVDRADRSKQPLCFLMFDLDKFKEVNDAYGHSRGDEVLRQLAHRFRHGEIAHSVMRKSDSVARFGGDEVAFVLPNTDREGAIIAAHRIVKALERDPVFVDIGLANPIKADIGASIGIGAFEGKEIDPTGEGMMAKADHCLFVLKGERPDAEGVKSQRRGQIAVDGQVFSHEEAAGIMQKRRESEDVR